MGEEVADEEVTDVAADGVATDVADAETEATAIKITLTLTKSPCPTVKL